MKNPPDKDAAFARGLSDRHLTGNHRQHEAKLLLGRYHWWSSHLVAPFSGGRLYDPATFLEAEQGVLVRAKTTRDVLGAFLRPIAEPSAYFALPEETGRAIDS